MNYKVSIIIPVYNVEKYIREALESIVRQTIGLEHLQVIMVNDCSTDGSGQIMDEYASKYANFISIHLSESSGAAGRPRNIGIERAEGQYMMFLDPDDYYEPDACEKLVSRIESDFSDFVIGNFRYDSVEEACLNLEDCAIDLIHSEPKLLQLTPAVWSKIYNTSFVKNNNITFPEKIAAQDLVFYIHCCLKAKKISLFEKVICNYRIRDAVDDKSISNKVTVDYFEGINKAYLLSKDLCEQYSVPHYFKYIIAGTLEYVLNKLVVLEDTSEQNIERLLLDMHWYFDLSKEYPVSTLHKWQVKLLNSIIGKSFYEFFELKTIIAEFQFYIKDLERSKKWYDAQLRNYQQNELEQREYIKQLESSKHWLEDHENTLREYIHELEKGKNWIENKYKELNHDKEKLNHDKEKLNNQIQEFKSRVCELDSQVHELEIQKIDLKDQIINLNNKVNQLSTFTGWLKSKKNRRI